MIKMEIIKKAISVLYSIAYTLKMSYKTDYKIEGFFDYVAPPLEGYPSSKLCHICGYKKIDLVLSDRTWLCPICNTTDN